MANIQIPEKLFVELYKFFNLDDYDPRNCDIAYIRQQLQIKFDKLQERAEYAAALSKMNKRDA